MTAQPNVTAFQTRVYALCSQIPEGHFATYKDISDALQSSPRAVGQALKRNPFAPVVPCHRVLASDYYIGGFFGSWGLAPSEPASAPKSGSARKSAQAEPAQAADGNVHRKLALLAGEGLLFDATGHLLKDQQSSRHFAQFTVQSSES
ncbi:6-O-methylguanine DNA methyltransferase [Entophlyctis helioformis]|nr:6-O-methylguanine DNA methyltransferase [Entophlyctis helioformis]